MLAVGGALAAGGDARGPLERWVRRLAKRPSPSPPRLGTTFSQLQCRYLGVEYRAAFERVCSLGLEYLRLCSYWDEIEPAPGVFDFSVLDWLIETAERHGCHLMLTVGMKAPRWPEFHFPAWVQERYETTSTTQPLDANPALADLTLNFIERVMQHTRQSSRLKYWQVENEPFSALSVNAGRALSVGFVQREVALVRSLALPGQRVLLTNSVSLTPFNMPAVAAFQASLPLADGLGLNVYSKIATGPNSYQTPLPSVWHTLAAWHSRLRNMGKEAWIAEAQAEPWEYHQLTPTMRSNPPSASPESADALVRRLAGLGFSPILLWGCEYWYWHLTQGRERWWKAMEQLLQRWPVDA